MSDCSDNQTDMRGTQVKHTGDEILMYADFTAALALYPTATTISSVATTSPDDATITLGTPAVVSSATSVPWFDEDGRVIQGTIAANKGVVVRVSDGAAQAAEAEPIRIWFAVTLSNGEILNRAGRLRVEGN